ncbi:MAG: hypothetical protein PHQ11_14455, partial [Paludibacter sp.]|nr:hypothetical protein [Paludibacter sp.]
MILVSFAAFHVHLKNPEHEIRRHITYKPHPLQTIIYPYREYYTDFMLIPIKDVTPAIGHAHIAGWVHEERD